MASHNVASVESRIRRHSDSGSDTPGRGEPPRQRPRLGSAGEAADPAVEAVQGPPPPRYVHAPRALGAPPEVRVDGQSLPPKDWLADAPFVQRVTRWVAQGYGPGPEAYVHHVTGLVGTHAGSGLSGKAHPAVSLLGVSEAQLRTQLGELWTEAGQNPVTTVALWQHVRANRPPMDQPCGSCSLLARLGPGYVGAETWAERVASPAITLDHLDAVSLALDSWVAEGKKLGFSEGKIRGIGPAAMAIGPGLMGDAWSPDGSRSQQMGRARGWLRGRMGSGTAQGHDGMTRYFQTVVLPVYGKQLDDWRQTSDGQEFEAGTLSVQSACLSASVADYDLKAWATLKNIPFNRTSRS